MIDAGRILNKGLIVIAVLGLMAMGCSAGGTALNSKPADLAKIRSMEVVDSLDSTSVVLDIDKEVTFTTVRLDDPPMMMLDLAGVEIDAEIGSTTYDKGIVTYINTSRNEVSKRIARLEIGLVSPAISHILQDGTRISIVFDKDPNMAAPAALSEPVVAEAEVASEAGSEPSAIEETPKSDASAEETTQAEASAPVQEYVQYDDATTVEDIIFDKSGNVVNITVSGDGKFGEPKVFMVGGDRLVIDMPGMGSVKSKDNIEVGSDTVKRIRMARHEGQNEMVRVVLDLACGIDYDVRPSGKSLAIAVAPQGSNVVARVEPMEHAVAEAAKSESAKTVSTASSASPAVETRMGTGRKVTVSVPPAAEKVDEPVNIYVSEENGSTVLSSAPPADGSMKKVEKEDKYVVTETKIYTGGKISFDIQDAELDKVIKLLADVAGLNLIMDPADVKGRVTLKLANVPWDQALDILLKIYQLDKVLEGNVLRVAPKAKLDAERSLDLRAIAEQKRLMEEAEDLYTKTFKINYSDAAELVDQVTKSLTKRGTATAIPRTNEIIVTDVKDKLEEIGDLINILDKEVNQIMIEARLVTVDVNYSHNFGVSWGVVALQARNQDRFGRNYAGGTGKYGALFNDDTDLYELAVPAETLGGLGGFAGAFQLFTLKDNITFDIELEALEDIGKAETLSAPKVMTLENQEAQITQGTTLYVQTTSASGTKPEPLNANLSLTVTPRVTGDNYIIMDVSATNNTPDPAPPAGSTASINTQAVQTSVLVKDGETVVLGGIYIKAKNKGDTMVPLLGRLPIIGHLFKQSNEGEETSELLIFITPKLVKQPVPVRV